MEYSVMKLKECGVRKLKDYSVRKLEEYSVRKLSRRMTSLTSSVKIGKLVRQAQLETCMEAP
jgi:hypothetical protein